MKICTKCKIEKEYTEFCKSKNGKEGLSSWCKNCLGEYQKEFYLENKEFIGKYHKEWYHKNKEYLKKVRIEYFKRYPIPKREYDRKTHLLSKYGITLEQYNEILDSQNGVCAICFTPSLFKYKNGKIRNLSVDHDHKTGQVRGILCDICNRGLGHFKDSIDLLEKGKQYLQEYELKQNDLTKNITIK